jgi:O-antigen ligase
MNYSTLKYKANYFALLLLVFVIPLERKFSPPIIVLFLLTCLINHRFEKLNFRKVLLFTGLFLLYLIGLLYSDFKDLGLKDLIGKLSLLIFPIAIFISNINFKDKLKTILYSFTLGCVFSGLIGLLNSIFGFYNTGDSSLFFYDKISFFLHPSYSAMYFCFSLLILYFQFFNNKIRTKKSLYFYYSLIFFFSVLIILSASKTGLISLFLIHFIAIIVWVSKSRTYWRGLGVFSLLVAITFLSYKSSTILQNRINEFIEVTKTGNTSKGSTTAARTIIWGLAIDLIAERPFFGYGTGAEKQVLIKKYNDENHIVFANKELNTHNQFLQTSIGIGLLGGVILLIMIFTPLFFSLRRNYYLYGFFLILIIVNLFTESMLERQAGVVFYALFNSLFFVSYFDEKIKLSA